MHRYTIDNGQWTFLASFANVTTPLGFNQKAAF